MFNRMSTAPKNLSENATVLIWCLFGLSVKLLKLWRIIVILIEII